MSPKNIRDLDDLMRWCKHFKKITIIYMPINLWETFTLEVQRRSILNLGKPEILQFRSNVRIIPIK